MICLWTRTAKNQDRDGRISYDEFQTMINPPKPPEPPKPTMADLNGLRQQRQVILVVVVMIMVVVSHFAMIMLKGMFLISGAL